MNSVNSKYFQECLKLKSDVDKALAFAETPNKWKLYSEFARAYLAKETKDIPINIQGFLYREKEIVMNGEIVDIEQSFLKWLKVSYNFHIEYWKETTIAELNESEKTQEKVVLSK